MIICIHWWCELRGTHSLYYKYIYINRFTSNRIWSNIDLDSSWNLWKATTEKSIWVENKLWLLRQLHVRICWSHKIDADINCRYFTKKKSLNRFVFAYFFFFFLVFSCALLLVQYPVWIATLWTVHLCWRFTQISKWLCEFFGTQRIIMDVQEIDDFFFLFSLNFTLFNKNKIAVFEAIEWGRKLHFTQNNQNKM